MQPHTLQTIYLVKRLVTNLSLTAHNAIRLNCCFQVLIVLLLVKYFSRTCKFSVITLRIQPTGSEESVIIISYFPFFSATNLAPSAFTQVTRGSLTPEAMFGKYFSDTSVTFYIGFNNLILCALLPCQCRIL